MTQATERTLVALDPQGMQTTHEALLTWCDRRIGEHMTTAEELEDSAIEAAEAGLRDAPILRQAKRNYALVDYYRNVRAAVEAGYVIVPNFPADAFAIRVREGSRPKGYSGSRKKVYRWHTPESQEAPGLVPAGLGVYVDPQPVGDYVDRQVRIRQSNGETELEWKPFYRPGDWADELEFPISLVRPEIMKPLKKAMGKLIFDDIAVVGVAPKRRRRAYQDPIVVGRIYGPKEGYNRRELTFFIAWWLDPEAI